MTRPPRDFADAARAVSAELGRRGWDYGRLAAEARADPGTIGDFLNGGRHPRVATLGKIERALGWPAGRLLEIADGVYVETVAADANDGLLLRLPPGAHEADRERARRLAQAAVDAYFAEHEQ